MLTSQENINKIQQYKLIYNMTLFHYALRNQIFKALKQNNHLPCEKTNKQKSPTHDET